MKKVKPIYRSDCCNTTFETKFNRLYNYYVCNYCNNKTNPKKLDMRKKENKPVVKKKDSGKMLSRALTNSTPSKSISKKLSPIVPPKINEGKLAKETTKKGLSKRVAVKSIKKAVRKLGLNVPDLGGEPYKVDGDDEFKTDKPSLIRPLKINSSWLEYMKAKKIKDGEYEIKVLGETVTILPNITILCIGNDSKKLFGNNTFLLLEKKIQEFMVTLTKELPNQLSKGGNRYFLADQKAFEFAFAKYPKVPKMFWFFAFITLVSESHIELNSKRIKRVLNKFYSSKSK